MPERADRVEVTPPASALGNQASEDLTARARIRDAALRLFADRGVHGATIRDIARSAGVSGGLVRHHFGSKADLRAACDAYAVRQLKHIEDHAVLGGQIGTPGFAASAQAGTSILLKYAARSMVDRSPDADTVFYELIELGTAWLEHHHPGRIRDPRAYAAVLVAAELGTVVMEEQLSRVLGADIFGPEGHVRLTRAKVGSTPNHSSARAWRHRPTLRWTGCRQRVGEPRRSPARHRGPGDGAHV